MPHQFIFAAQVEKILKSGKTEIEISQGARISAAAADLIRAHKIKLKTIEPGKSTETAVESKAGPLEKNTESNVDKQEKEVPEAADLVRAHLRKINTTDPDASVAATTETDSEISQEMLEEIVNRVVLRFKQLKGVDLSEAEGKKRKSTSSQPVPDDDDDLVICRCEEITKGSIKEAIQNGMQTLNGIKRVTRAGMGLCQGQTCQRLVIQIISQELGLSAAEIEPTTARGPVRPLRLEVFANS